MDFVMQSNENVAEHVAYTMGNSLFSDCAHLGGAVMKEKWIEYLRDFIPKWRHTPGWEKFNEWRTPDPADGYRQMASQAGFLVLYSQVRISNYIQTHTIALYDRT